MWKNLLYRDEFGVIFIINNIYIYEWNHAILKKKGKSRIMIFYAKNLIIFWRSKMLKFGWNLIEMVLMHVQDCCNFLWRSIHFS